MSVVYMDMTLFVTFFCSCSFSSVCCVLCVYSFVLFHTAGCAVSLFNN